ncbi:hypothetical protein QFZ49_001207 [Streptomyces turgidiscabies]|uniref:Uncharacterized protein n=1 Tax=Streptomyces turgidiscabies TaxID=85558 RepID=A0ABU0RH65_9ACTN|nr:hypothetical protein [Streptomyces turgidiscabies]
MTYETGSLRRYYPDQVPGVAFRPDYCLPASQPYRQRRPQRMPKRLAEVGYYG